MTRGVPNYGSDLENEEGGTQRWNEIGRADKVMKGEAATEMEPEWPGTKNILKWNLKTQPKPTI